MAESEYNVKSKRDRKYLESSNPLARQYIDLLRVIRAASEGYFEYVLIYGDEFFGGALSFKDIEKFEKNYRVACYRTLVSIDPDEIGQEHLSHLEEMLATMENANRVVSGFNYERNAALVGPNHDGRAGEPEEAVSFVEILLAK